MKLKELKKLIFPVLNKDYVNTIKEIPRDVEEQPFSSMVRDISVYNNIVILRLSEKVHFPSLEEQYEKIKDLPDDYNVIVMQSDGYRAILSQLDYSNKSISFNHKRLIPEYIMVDIDGSNQEEIILTSFNLEEEYNFDNNTEKDTELQKFIYHDDFNIVLPNDEILVSVNYISETYTTYKNNKIIKNDLNQLEKKGKVFIRPAK